MASTTSGVLFIADITGYTAFLSASELEHAQGTLTSLLELLIEHTRPPLIISRLAGDAVISYGLQDKFMQPQTFVELIEDTYVAFRKAIERMVLNNTCQCAACANVGTLDLKFFVHYGEFGLQRLSAHDELVGSDVILLHRLLKNSVAEALGTRAYTLYTDVALQRLGLADMRGRLQAHSETYEHLGQVPVWIQDMHPVWEAKRETLRVTIPEGRATPRTVVDIAMPPHQVWDYLVQPEHRKALVGSDRQEIFSTQAGRIAPGSQYQCFHGDRIVMQTVLEWQPFELLTTEDQIMPGLFVVNEARLAPIDGATRLTVTYGQPRGPLLKRLLALLMLPYILGVTRRHLEDFKAHAEADLARRGGAAQGQTAIPSEEVAEAASASLGAPDAA